MYLIFLAIAILFGTRTTSLSCGINETYSNSSSTSQATCKTLNTFTVPNCTTQPGCICNDGYVRKYKNGPCVPRSSCFRCKLNEQYSRCGGCPRTCLQQRIIYCTAVCREGCVCKPRFLRDQQGNCIPPSLCKTVTQCPKNQEYLDCGPACPSVCGQPPQYCTQQCVRGCYCIEGYILNANNTCIPKCLC